MNRNDDTTARRNWWVAPACMVLVGLMLGVSAIGGLW